MTRIMLTGATGFVGSNLAAALAKNGNFQLSLLVRKQSNKDSIKEISNRVKIYTIDGLRETVDYAIHEFMPEIVIHLASMVRPEHQPDEIEGFISTNITFPSFLLESMSRHGVMLFLNTGTFWEYMNGSKEYNPVCLYAATKRSFEDILKFYSEAKGIKAITLTLYDNYGPNDRRKKLMWWLKQSINSEEPISFSPGEQQLDLVYIDDVISAYLKGINYLRNKSNFEIEHFPIATGEIHTLKEVASIYEQIVNKPLNIAWGKRPYRAREVMIVNPNLSKSRTKLGWIAQSSLAQGMRRMIEIEANANIS